MQRDNITVKCLKAHDFFFNDILTLEVNHQIERIISLFQDSDLSNHFVISLMAPSLALDISLTFPDF